MRGWSGIGWSECICVSRGEFAVVCEVGRVWVGVGVWLCGVGVGGCHVVWVWLIVWCLRGVVEWVCGVGSGGREDRIGPVGGC